MALVDLDIVAELLEDPRPADVSTTHYFELTDDTLVYFRLRLLAFSKHCYGTGNIKTVIRGIYYPCCICMGLLNCNSAEKR